MKEILHRYLHDIAFSYLVDIIIQNIQNGQRTLQDYKDAIEMAEAKLEEMQTKEKVKA